MHMLCTTPVAVAGAVHISTQKRARVWALERSRRSLKKWGNGGAVTQRDQSK